MNDATRDLLIETLNAAVFMIQLDLSALSEPEREHRRRLWAPQAADAIAHGGDTLLYPVRARRNHREEGTAHNFNQLARGLAVLSFQPGGVTFLGRHWCTNHEECLRVQEPEPGPTRARKGCASQKPLVEGRCPDCGRRLKRGHRKP